MEGEAGVLRMILKLLLPASEQNFLQVSCSQKSKTNKKQKPHFSPDLHHGRTEDIMIVTDTTVDTSEHVQRGCGEVSVNTALQKMREREGRILEALESAGLKMRCMRW